MKKLAIIVICIFCSLTLFSKALAEGSIAPDKITTKEIIINGSKTKAITIIPSAENEYAPIAWKDQQGNIVAMIVAHEKQTEGAVHNHLSIYTANKDRTKRTGRIDIQFGSDDPIVSFEKVNVLLKKDAKLLLPDEKGGVVQVYSDGGIVKTRKTTYSTNLIPD